MKWMDLVFLFCFLFGVGVDTTGKGRTGFLPCYELWLAVDFLLLLRIMTFGLDGTNWRMVGWVLVFTAMARLARRMDSLWARDTWTGLVDINSFWFRHSLSLPDLWCLLVRGVCLLLLPLLLLLLLLPFLFSKSHVLVITLSWIHELHTGLATAEPVGSSTIDRLEARLGLEFGTREECGNGVCYFYLVDDDRWQNIA